MTLLDGKKLAEKILEELRRDIAAFPKPPRLAVVMVGEDPATESYIRQKTRTAGKIGVTVKLFRFPPEISTNALREKAGEIARDKKNDGVIVQLPLPPHINTQTVLNAVTPEKDVDMLSSRAVGNFESGKSRILPPVVGAVDAFFREYGISVKGKHALVVGAGRLVGKPIANWFMREGATVSVAQSHTENLGELARMADIIVSGVGKPNLIRGGMVKDGVVVVDAGTSEAGDKLVGDVDFETVAPKASFITPVPGGVGPMTGAMLLKNLIVLSRQKNKSDFEDRRSRSVH